MKKYESWDTFDFSNLSDQEIKNVLSVLSDLDNQLLVRLTGSGGTCFALFDNTENAHEAAEKLNKKFPDWWINPKSILP